MDEDGLARKLAIALRGRGATMRRLWRVMTHRTGADMINRIEFLSAWGER